MQKEDYDWFIKNYDNIYEKHGICYVAIKNKRVIGVYNTFGVAVNETIKVEKPGSFIVQLCNGNESGYTNHIASSDVCVL